MDGSETAGDGVAMPLSPDMIRQRGNHLVAEQSLYLQQHAFNPIDWYPWGEEALDRARLEDKPVFLSVGYSSCHWCHVMEHEVFEDNDVAAYMNEHFVCIKVDREERPDLDAVYIQALQLVTATVFEQAVNNMAAWAGSGVHTTTTPLAPLNLGEGGFHAVQFSGTSRYTSQYMLYKQKGWPRSHNQL